MNKLYENRNRRYRYFLLAIILCGMIAICCTFYMEMLHRIPDTIYIKTGYEEKIEYNVPVKGRIVKNCVPVAQFGEEITKSDGIPVDFTKDMVFYTENVSEYQMKLRLFGILPYKDVKMEAISEQTVYPLGTPIGIYMKMEGVLVLDIGSFLNEHDVECSPSGGILEKGDYIIAIDGETVSQKGDVVKRIEENVGGGMNLTIRRGDYEMNRLVFPQKGKNGERKLGIWIRDSIQGIGTITYADKYGNFRALGHGVNDSDTNELIALDYGTIYETEIVSIKKGVKGTPGGLTGVIEYTKSKVCGEITMNTSCGIQGKCKEDMIDKSKKSYPVGFKHEVEKKDAQILCAINGESKLYDIEIKGINYSGTNKKRELAIEVTDEELLSLTGGIVQGMSGSPIIQNGKIIGAVTHVLVNDPKKGYGIFIEEMMN